MSPRAWIPLLTVLVLALTGALPVPAGTAAPAPAASTTTSARTALTTAQFESQLLALTNARRKKVGCKTLRSSPALTKAARGHTRKMAAAGNLSHQLPGESGLAKRIQKAGYTKWTAAAENIAWGAATPKGVFAMWMNSSGHKANIQRCTYRDAGFGVVVKNGRPWVTLVLGRRR